MVSEPETARIDPHGGDEDYDPEEVSGEQP